MHSEEDINRNDESNISILLKLRNNDEFLFHYVMAIANSILNGEIEEYDTEEFMFLEEAIEEAISIVIYSILDVDAIEEEEFENEYKKTYQRIWDYAAKIKKEF